MNMKLLAVVTPPSIYHGCSTHKTFWEGKFTDEEKFTLGELSAVNMNNCGSRNVRGNRDIKGSDNYVSLDISLKFGSLDKIRITSSDPKDNLVGLRKGFITSLGLKSNAIPKKYKKARYAIKNVIMNDLSKIIRDFDKLPYKIYERRRPKHDPNDSYFYLSRQLANFLMKDNALNLHAYPVRT